MAFDPITEGIGFARSIVDKIWPDAEKKEERAAQLAVMLAERDSKRDESQAAINAEEAKSTRLFVAGWRPAVGWVCVGSLFYAQIGYSFLTWVSDMVAIHLSVPVPALPKPDTTITLELLFALLGLGGLRTYEKVRGVK